MAILAAYRLESRGRRLPDYLDDMDAVEKEAKAAMLKELIAGYASKRPKTGQESLRVLCLFQELPVLLKRTMSAIPMSFEKKQHYLNVDKLSEKYELAYKFIQEEINILEIREDFQSKIKEKVEENQKEYILREQMKVIRQELGEEDTVQESDTFLQSTEALDAPEEIKEKLRKEIKRYKTLSSGSAESSVARGYIETLLELRNQFIYKIGIRCAVLFTLYTDSLYSVIHRIGYCFLILLFRDISVFLHIIEYFFPSLYILFRVVNRIIFGRILCNRRNNRTFGNRQL